MIDEPFALTQGDRISPLWNAFEAHLEKRLAQLRAQNEGDLNKNETAKLRGRIAEIRSLLNLSKDRPDITHEQQ